MERSEVMPDESAAPAKRLRGAGRGGGFFALGRDTWEKLWEIETTNRLNLVTAFLVLLAGTGSDHRLSKWSAKACEDHVGMGKPRAKHAIDELIASKLISRTASSTRLMPQYELPSLHPDADPIFLPVALITSLAGETSVLRRVRETGDPLVLRMLIDLYGSIQLDATHGIPLAQFRSGMPPKGENTVRKLAEVGANSVWGFRDGGWRGAGGDWTQPHLVKASGDARWAQFWERVALLAKMGAVWFEPWVFDGDAFDAEPLMPLDASGYYALSDPSPEAKLCALALEACRELVGSERPYIFDNSEFEYFVPLVGHHQTPAFREVMRLRVEPDTPGRRLAWKRRQSLIETKIGAIEDLISNVRAGVFDKPLQARRVLDAVK